MKKVNLLIGTVLLALFSTLGYAQAPDAFNYQAVLRDAGGSIIANQTVEMRFSVRTGNANGPQQYREEQVLTTNEFGLVDHAIGTGTPFFGEFDDITWGDDDKFLRVELDNGDGYVTIGTQQLVSVPYALNAKTAETLSGGLPSSGWNTSGNNISNSNSGNVGIGVTNPSNKLHVSGGITSGNLIVNGRSLGAFGSSLVWGNNVPQTGNTNTAVGNEAMQSNTSGFDNVAFGTLAGASNTTGSKNTAIGVRALEVNATGEGLIGIGHLANVTSSNFNNAIAIGNFTAVDASNKARIGNGSYNSIGGQVNWTAFSDERVKDNISEQVVGLEFIQALRPVTYNYNVDKQERLMGLNEVHEGGGKKDIEKILFSGFIAQEVEEAAREADYNFSGIDKSGNILGLRYAEFTVPLVKAVQEQQAQIEAQQEQIDALIEEIEALKNK